MQPGSKTSKQHVQARKPVQAALPALTLGALGRFWPNETQNADLAVHIGNYRLLQTNPEDKTRLALSCPGQAKSGAVTLVPLDQFLPAILSNVKALSFCRRQKLKSDNCAHFLPDRIGHLSAARRC